MERERNSINYDKVFFSTKDLSVGYNGKELIKEINIELYPGEILTLIGPNGAGKSTILKSITKHLETIKGDSFIEDLSVASMSYKEMSKRLAVVLTEKIKGELLTCYDVVATGRYPYTGNLGILSEEDKVKVIDAMAKVHAEGLAERDFSAISDGQRQRVLLARAICQEPEIIVLDEPTSFLDIKHKLELLSILREMAKEKGITVIMSLHEIDLAQKISDKIMCVKGDRIDNFGVPEEIFKDEIINELYEIKDGTYNITFGSVELPAPEGEPGVFVISGNGSGISTFRKLQKDNIPFYAGIIYENDIDFQVAKNLATKVFSEKPFCRISEAVLKESLSAIAKCKRVINCELPIEELNADIKVLIDEADKLGILEKQ